MREMKGPRVWDDELGKMLYSKFEQYDDSIGFRFSEHLETENPVYMWPVGLKDKNGREIYEGDIIEETGRYESYLYKVVWNESNVTFDFVDLATEEVFHAEDIYFNHVEVIGNIHDNPELLPAQNENIVKEGEIHESC